MSVVARVRREPGPRAAIPYWALCEIGLRFPRACVHRSIGHLAEFFPERRAGMNWVHRKESPLRPQDRDELTKYRKLEAIEAELAQNRRVGQITLLLAVVMNAVLLALLAWHLLGHD